MADINNNGVDNSTNPQNFDNNFTNPETTPQDFTSPNQDFTAPGPNQDFTNPAPDFSQEPAPAPSFEQAPVNDFTQTPEAPSFSQTGFDQPADTQPIPDANASQTPAPEAPNTFTETKSGNKTFLIAAIVGVVILLILAVVLVLANRGGNDTEDPLPTTDTSQTGSSNTTDDTTNEPVQTVVDNTKTGGEGTPASNARIFSETEVPTDWLLQKFRLPTIDEDGNCLNISLCGANADNDQDGAETIDEYNYQLDPLSEDTDGDGISDGDELFIYYTNPTEDDTDSDGFTDGQEIANCFDPSLVSVQFSSTKLAEITSNISLRKLHNPTTTTLTDAGATPVDLSTNGTVLAKCNETADDTTADTTATDDSAATDTTTDTSGTGVEVN